MPELIKERARKVSLSRVTCYITACSLARNRVHYAILSMNNRRWTKEDDEALVDLLKHDVDIRAAARWLGRSRTATRLRAMRLRRHPRTLTQGTPVPSGTGAALGHPPTPTQAGSVAVVSFQQQVLSKSLSTASQAALEPRPPPPKPEPKPYRLTVPNSPDDAYLAMAIDAATGLLTVRRVLGPVPDDGDKLHPRRFADSPFHMVTAWMHGRRGREQT